MRTPSVVNCEECGQVFGYDPKGLGLCGPCTAGAEQELRRCIRCDDEVVESGTEEEEKADAEGLCLACYEEGDPDDAGEPQEV